MKVKVDHMMIVSACMKTLAVRLRTMVNSMIDGAYLLNVMEGEYYGIQRRLSDSLETLERYAGIMEKMGDMIADIAELCWETEQKIIANCKGEAVGGNRTISYLKDSAEQVAFGNYTKKGTALGTAGSVALGFTGFDAPADLRDLTADVVHKFQGEDVSLSQIGLDILAFLPGVGALKYTDEVAEVAKQCMKHGDEAAEIAKQFMKHGDEASEVLQVLLKMKMFFQS